MIVFSRRFRDPPECGHGGYTSLSQALSATSAPIDEIAIEEIGLGEESRGRSGNLVDWMAVATTLRTPQRRRAKLVEQGAGTPVGFVHSGVGSAGEWKQVFSLWPEG